MILDTSLLKRAIPEGSMRYFAWQYTPKPHREVIAALFLIETELRDTANAPHDVAHIRLQWWREEIDRLAKGNAQHPAAVVLQEHKRGDIDFTLLEPLLLTTAQDIAHSTYETDTELNRYFKEDLGSLMKLAACYLNPNVTLTLLDAAEQFGSFIRQTETLRDLRDDIHHGRLYLPLATLNELNIEYEMLQDKNWPGHFITWLQARCQQCIQQHIQLTTALLANEASVLRPILVIAALHEKVLQELCARPNNFYKRLELGVFTKLWTAWNTARRFNS